jgi:GT2 family glycosyltransferase
MTFTILIPIHNRLPITRQGLLALHNALNYYKSNGSSTCQFQVVVIDDGSTDGSSAWISENYPSIYLLQGNGDLWWTGAVNLGARLAVETLKSQYVILWNDDTTCGIDYFYELEKVLMLSEEYRSSILACKVLWQDKPDTLFNFGCSYNARTGKKKLIGFNGKDTDFQEIMPIDW